MDTTWFGGRLGTLFSVAYNMRNQNMDYWTNGAGGYVYRSSSTGSTVKGTSNGVSYLIDHFKGQPLYAHINLEKGERSELAELASDLL